MKKKRRQNYRHYRLLLEEGWPDFNSFCY